MTRRWESAGRIVVVEEDEPGIVKVTTEVLGHLLHMAGFTELENSPSPPRLWQDPVETRPGTTDGVETR